MMDDLGAPSPPCTDLVCWSHLRWKFVFQRPQHLMVRWARTHRVFFVEEPAFEGGPARLEMRTEPSGVVVVVPFLEPGRPREEQVATLRALFDEMHAEHKLERPIGWYYSPMFLEATGHLEPSVIVYDCMDQLSAFAGAPPELTLLETELLSRADAVLTGGHSLYEAKRGLHPNVHPFPSSVDVAHFAKARTLDEEPADQASIPRPRVGFHGVIDERMDLALLDELAALRPDLQLVLIGPVVKIDPAMLPRRPNLHYLGMKAYEELPAYLAGWDVAMLPFAMNEATRYISPTKTPEYMAGGCPVVSTPIRDVVHPYGEAGLVHIASDARGFSEAIAQIEREDEDARRRAHDAYLSQLSWDETFARMRQVVEDAARAKAAGVPGVPDVAGQRPSL